MKRKTAFVLLTNGVLAAILLVVSAVCFIPFGVSASGRPSDRVYYNGNRDSAYVSLMFNVYWGTEFLPSILDTLDDFGVHTTFFIGGSWADDHAESLRAIAERGHELGNHGYFHKDQDGISYEANLEEIRVCGELIEKLTGVHTELFAPPSGAYGEDTVRAAEVLGYKTILWSKDTIDWRDHDEALILERATAEIAGGDLVLMHPTQQTAQALPGILQRIQAAGLEVVPVSVNSSGVEKV